MPDPETVILKVGACAMLALWIAELVWRKLDHLVSEVRRRYRRR